MSREPLGSVSLPGLLRELTVLVIAVGGVNYLLGKLGVHYLLLVCVVSGVAGYTGRVVGIRWASAYDRKKGWKP